MCMVGGLHGSKTFVAGGHAWQGGMCGWEACMARGHVWLGDMCGRGACMAGGCAWQGVCMAGGVCGGVHGRGVCGRRDGHCSGRYASYWNAFLLNTISFQI